MTKKTVLISLPILMALLFSNTLYAGTLDDFEYESTTPQSKPSKRNKPPAEPSCSGSNCRASRSFFSEFTNSLFSEMIVVAISVGTETTLARTSDYRQTPGITKKAPGSHLLPSFRIGGSWQAILPEMEVEARDLKLDLGYSLFAMSYRTTRYIEESAQDDLDLSYLHGLYRLSYGNDFVLSIGLGRAELKGNKRSSGSSISIPWILRLTDNIYVEGWQVFSSFHQTSFTDLDYSLLYSVNGTAVSLGYRSVSNPVSSLSGPYIGLSYSY